MLRQRDAGAMSRGRWETIVRVMRRVGRAGQDYPQPHGANEQTDTPRWISLELKDCQSLTGDIALALSVNSIYGKTK